MLPASAAEPTFGTWSRLGSGMDSYVNALTTYDGQLIAGGYFSRAGGAPAENVAAWNGSSWMPLGSGTDRGVLALASYDGRLYAAGLFFNAGGVPANGIAAWDGQAWSPLEGGVTDGDLGHLGIAYALVAYDGRLIVGGDFTMAGGVSANYVAAWDGSCWSPLGSGMNGQVYCLTVHDGRLIAGGDFTMAGGVSANHIAAWDGVAWTPLGSGTSGFVSALTLFDDQLIVGGAFASAGGSNASRIAAWELRLCVCSCHGDPGCDGIRCDLQDVVQSVNVAFRSAPAVTDPDCPCERTDVNGDGATTIIDVVKTVDVAFRGADPAAVFYHPCGSL